METNSEVIHLMSSLLVLTMSTAAVSDKQKVYSMNILQSKLTVMKYEEVTSIRRNKEKKLEFQLIHIKLCQKVRRTNFNDFAKLKL